jgi:hypothetical protein
MSNPTVYTYSLSQDFPGGQINPQKLQIAIENAITTLLDAINVNGDVVQIVFDEPLSAADKTTLDGNTTNPAGGLIASTETSPFISGIAPDSILGSLSGAQMNSTADQIIFMTSSRYIIRQIIAYNPSSAIIMALGGIYSAKNKGGSIIVPATQIYSGLSSKSKFEQLTLASFLSNTFQTQNELFFSLTLAEMSSKLVDIVVIGDDYSSVSGESS